MQQAQRDAARLLQDCPPAVRARFEEFYAKALAHAFDAAHQAGGHIDPYAVEAEVIRGMRLGSLGERDDGQPSDGVGFVPVPNARVAWVPDARARVAAYRADPARFRTPTAAGGANSTATDDAQKERTMRRIGFALAGLAVLWLVLQRVGSDDAAPAAAGDPAPSASPAGTSTTARSESAARGRPQASGVPLAQGDPGTAANTGSTLGDVRVRGAELNSPASVEFQSPKARDHVVLRVVAQGSDLGGTWAPRIDPGTAAWLPGSIINPVLCLPPDAAEQLEAYPRGTPIQLRLVSGAVRRYEVLTVDRVGRWQTELLDQRRAGLTVIACGMDGDERVVVQAIFRPDGGPEAQPHYAAVRLDPFASMRIVGVEREDETERDAVVRLDVSVTNTGSTPLPLRDLADQLLADKEPLQIVGRRDQGAVLDPGRSRIMTFRYVAPPTDTPDLVWRVIAPTGQRADIAVMMPSADAGLEDASVLGDSGTPSGVVVTAGNDAEALEAATDTPR
jgi:hypothetical protein